MADYANGLKMVMRDHGWMGLGTCCVRYEGDDGWVETGDSGRIEFSSGQAPRRAAGRSAEERHLGREPREELLPVRSRPASRPTRHAEVVARSHIICHAAYIAWQLGRPLKFDPVKVEFIGDDEANRMRSRAVRDPWRI